MKIYICTFNIKALNKGKYESYVTAKQMHSTNFRSADMEDKFKAWNIQKILRKFDEQKIALEPEIISITIWSP